LLSDTGLLSHVLGLDRARAEQQRTLFGHVLENFVAMERVKQLTWSKTRCQLFHFRTTAGQEVDLVLESPSGELIGIEVKAGANVQAKDLAGLRLLAELTGKRFRHGFVLYTGNSVVPFAKNLHALPIQYTSGRRPLITVAWGNAPERWSTVMFGRRPYSLLLLKTNCAYNFVSE
jgi:hypothetical protein